MKKNTTKEEQIDQVMAKKNISKEEAQKEVAQKGIEEITGKTANQASQEAREILEVYDALESQNSKKINKEKRDTDLKTVKEFQEKIDKNPTLADDLVKAGLGSEQLSITAGKLENRIDEVAQEMEIHGETNSEQKEENSQNIEKSEQEFSNQENNSDDLLPPPILPKTSKEGQKNMNSTLENASKKGLQMCIDTAKEGQNLSTTVANTAGEMVGTVAEKGAQKVLGRGIIGKTGGKIAKEFSKKAVRSAILTNIGELGK